jgi:sensor histidine kinase YesM
LGLSIFFSFEIIEFKEFTLLFSGFILTLSIYHFLLYFQHKDRTYLFYSLYTFLIFTSSYPNIETTFSTSVLSNLDPYFNLVVIPREWIYNTLYLLFAKTLVEFHIYKPKWNKVLNISIIVYFVVLFSAMSYGRLTGNYAVIGEFYNYFFSPTIPILALISFYHLYKMDTVLKYYIIIGSFIYMIFAETAFYFTEDVQRATVIFYIGVIIENVLFSLALGAKQKIILNDKNIVQGKLITQLKENEKLKDEIHEKLEENIVSLNKQAEVDKLEKELAELKITFLRSQMNPHFIFNSLNSIKFYIINNEKENAIYYLNKFSKLIRKILATTKEKEISLADEIETMDLYLKIENIRFENEIEFEHNIDETLNLNTIKVPSLILQPFLENAIWHGLATKEGSKKLVINIENINDAFIEFSITDNGVGREKATELKQQKTINKDSLGLLITEERLNNYYSSHQENYSLKFIDLKNESNTPIGTKVVLKLPQR